MKFTRIFLALILTVAMLYIARTNSRGRPELYSQTSGDYSLEMISVPKVEEFKGDRINVTIDGPAGSVHSVVLRTSQPEDSPRENLDAYAGVPMARSTINPTEYYVDVVAGAKGGRFHYYFEVIDTTGAVLATFTDEEGEPWFLRYIGAVPAWITASHIFFIFATVFCVAMAAMHSLSLFGSGTVVRPVAIYLFLATVFCFVGGYPFGIPMNWYAFGGTWEGVPFGTDATDNKTQLLQVYLIFGMLATLGSLTRGKLGRDFYSPKVTGLVGIGSFAVMLFIYLIPHSIQFSAGFTYAFCYGWTGIVALLWLTGWLRSRKDAGVTG